MDLGLKNKVALVTGSSRGIGFAIAKMLRDEGGTVVLNGRDEVVLNRACDSLGSGVCGFAADVSHVSESQALVDFVVQKQGRLDALVCNVGSGASVKPGAENYDEWLRVFHLNFLSATNMIEAALPHLEKSRGTILCVSSICGSEIIPGAPVTYSVAKKALDFYIKGVAKPFADRGVRINGVAPGNVFFEGGSWEKRVKENPQAVQEMLEKNVALKKFGTPEEIASMAGFLLSPKASFMTGETVVVDGGQVKS